MNPIVRPGLVGVSSLIALTAVGSAFAQKPKPAPKAVPYAKVEAVLKAKCVGCHNGPGGKAGVNLASYASVKGGKWQGKPLVVAKKPAQSVLVNAIHGTGMMKMPPGGMLSPEEMKTLEAWIASGAKK